MVLRLRFLSRQAISNGQKKQRSALLANRFLTHNGLVFGRKNSRRKIHRHLPRKRIKLQLCKWSTTTVKRKQLFSIWRKKNKKKNCQFLFPIWRIFFLFIFRWKKSRKKSSSFYDLTNFTILKTRRQLVNFDLTVFSVYFSITIRKFLFPIWRIFFLTT